MKNFQSVEQLLIEDEAATAVEYAVILMLVLLVVISAVQFFGTQLRGSFETTSTELTAAN